MTQENLNKKEEVQGIRQTHFWKKFFNIRAVFTKASNDKKIQEQENIKEHALKKAIINEEEKAQLNAETAKANEAAAEVEAKLAPKVEELTARIEEVKKLLAELHQEEEKLNNEYDSELAGIHQKLEQAQETIEANFKGKYDEAATELNQKQIALKGTVWNATVEGINEAFAEALDYFRKKKLERQIEAKRVKNAKEAARLAYQAAYNQAPEVEIPESLKEPVAEESNDDTPKPPAGPAA